MSCRVSSLYLTFSSALLFARKMKHPYKYTGLGTLHGRSHILVALRIKSCDDMWWQRGRTRERHKKRRRNDAGGLTRSHSACMFVCFNFPNIERPRSPFLMILQKRWLVASQIRNTDYLKFVFYFIGCYIILEYAQATSCGLNAPYKPKGSEYSHLLLKMQSASVPISNRITLFWPVIVEPQFGILISSPARHKVFHRHCNQLF